MRALGKIIMLGTMAVWPLACQNSSPEVARLEPTAPNRLSTATMRYSNKQRPAAPLKKQSGPPVFVHQPVRSLANAGSRRTAAARVSRPLNQVDAIIPQETVEQRPEPPVVKPLETAMSPEPGPSPEPASPEAIIPQISAPEPAAPEPASSPLAEKPVPEPAAAPAPRLQYKEDGKVVEVEGRPYDVEKFGGADDE